MIKQLNSLLRHLLITQLKSISGADQVGFQPPNQDWRTVVSNLGVRNALNIYLFEMSENRKLRTNERLREYENGVATDTPAPRRVDCHYLITAWSPATVTPAIEPTFDEHSLLYDVTAVLMKQESLVPREIYAPDPLPAGFPQQIADTELPLTILSVEGFPKYAEFWGTMGDVHPWKPAIYLIVTIPVIMEKTEVGRMVTTMSSGYVIGDSVDTRYQIGGTITNNEKKPVAGAWVRLETTTGKPIQIVDSNEMGRFTFNRIQPGHYQLSARAPGFAELKAQAVTIPSASGEYNISFP